MLARDTRSYSFAYNAVLIIILKRVEELKSQRESKSETKSQLEESVRYVRSRVLYRLSLASTL